MNRSPLRSSPVFASLASLLALVVAACGGDDGVTTPAPGVADIRVTPATDTLLALDDTVRLSAVAVDAGGNTVSGVTFAWSSSDETVLSISDEGLATAVGPGDAAITATADQVAGSATLAVIQRVAGVTVTPPLDTLTTVGATVQLTAEAADGNENPIADAAFVWQSSDQGVATVDTAGLVTARGAGVATITAAARGVPGNARVAVEQEVAEVVFVDQPSSAVAGEALDPAIRVELRDAAGNRVADAEVEITLALADDPGGASLHGTRTLTTTAGAAGFTGIWLDRAGSGYTLTVELAGAAADTSAAFDVTAAAPVGLGIVAQPTTGEGGASLSVGVAVQDEFGNTVPDTAATIELSFGPGAGSAVLSGALVDTTVAGVATFDSVFIDLPGSYTLDAAAREVALWQVRSAPIDISLTFASVYAGQRYTCGLTVAQRVYCWGESRDGATSYFVTPFPIQNDGGNRYEEITLSDQWGSSAVTSTGAWQYFFDANRSFEPGDVSVGVPVSRPGSGSRQHCAIAGSGDAYCYGWNTSGQLGNGDTTRAVYENAPVPVSGGIAFTRIDGGYDHTCGLDEFGIAYCWGSSAYGQLGAGGAASDTACLGPPCSLTPVGVAGQHTFQSIAAGDAHTCGLTTGGAVYCWGLNLNGQLGSAAGDSSSVPVLVADPAGGAVTWVAISAGGAHTCGITDAGAAYCWGDNPDGRLGIGTTGGVYTAPRQVAGGLSFAGIDGGVLHTCAWTESGQAYCWGDNSRGELGDGTTTERPEPVPVLQ